MDRCDRWFGSALGRSRRPGSAGLALGMCVAVVVAGSLWADAGAVAGADVAPTGPHLMLPNPAAAAPAVVGGAVFARGGPVQDAPRVFVVFWGWGSDPSGEASYLTSFLASVGATPYLNTVTQYGGGNPVGMYGGSWADSAGVPAQPTDAQVQSEAASAADHFGTGSSVNVSIVVATPSGHSTAGFGSTFCAYHGAVAARPNITYTNLPYVTDAGAGCGARTVNGAAGNLDGVSIIAGHELAEVITDPLLNGWTDSSGLEIADKCAWTNLANITTAAGRFAVQSLWSNDTNGCALVHSAPVTSWSVLPGSNFAVYSNGQVPGEVARSGARYAATNTATGGGGIYEDISGLAVNAGDTFCATAWLRTQSPSTGASGSFDLWLLGGAADHGSIGFSGLGAQGNWTPSTTCVVAKSAHSALRAQFYPAVNSATLEIDDVDVHRSQAQNGGFELGGSSWSAIPGSNFVSYANGQVAGEAARSGSRYGATNTSVGGGGIYQDITGLAVNGGDTYCASAYLRSQTPSIGARGSFDLWMLGGSENGSASYSGLGNQNHWSASSTCVTALSARSAVRVQLYPAAANSPTVEVDDVDLHRSDAKNGGFESLGSSWSAVPGSNVAFYSSGQIAGESARSGISYAATNTVVGGGGIYQDIGGLAVNAGDTFCATAWLRTQNPSTGASGAFDMWLLGGSADHASVGYAGLGAQGNWSPSTTCVTATSAHSAVRIQLYPAVNSPTVQIDDVDVHRSQAQNGGFELGR